MKSNGEILWERSFEFLKYMTGEGINKVKVSFVTTEQWENKSGKNIVIHLSNGETYIWQMFWHGMEKSDK